ncbi:hypothetical protein TL16_g07423, partial [Triparma laevis f. inornata]|uniref:Fatty acid desaturase domain-containing protein n=2 Tax=Triparma laevis TaxID=1534972 RepID=A0A9W7FQM6_9STRA
MLLAAIFLAAICLSATFAYLPTVSGPFDNLRLSGFSSNSLRSISRTTSPFRAHSFPSSPFQNARKQQQIQQRLTRLASATLESPATSTPTPPPAYDCTDDAECIAVPACDSNQCRTTLDCRIHNQWYNLEGWRKSHPAGVHWIDWYNGRDATEVMDAFHSEKARNMYQRLPKSDSATVKMLEQITEPDSEVTKNFRILRSKLEEEGWWNRDITHEIKLLTIWASCGLSSAYFTHSDLLYSNYLSTFLLGIFFTQSGWLGHDYVHGVDKFTDRFRQLTTAFAGLGVTWWSDKHNKHHALTNEVGVDEDIATDPFLYTWAPDPEYDSPLRKIQHLIFYVPFSALFALWRVDTMTVAVDAVEEKRPGAKKELWILLAHYATILSVFPLSVFVPAVFLSGLMSALIVTPTHQSEEMFQEYQPQWAEAQFLSTRSAKTSNPFSEWIWGGMQYQLEHHLFPTMPRSKYPLLKPILTKFAADNNIEGGYRESGEWEILKMNWELYRKVALADPVEGAPYSRGHGQLGAILSSSTPAAKQKVA